MCNCGPEVKLQEYQNQVCLLPPEWSSKPSICVDACLEQEIRYLWAIGIETTGCCCGHNACSPYIGVAEKDIERMIGMGYNVVTNCTDSTRQDSFYPQGLLYAADEIWEIAQKSWRAYERRMIAEEGVSQDIGVDLSDQILEKVKALSTQVSTLLTNFEKMKCTANCKYSVGFATCCYPNAKYTTCFSPCDKWELRENLSGVTKEIKLKDSCDDT